MSRESRAGFFFGRDPQAFDLPHPRLELPVILIVHRVFLRAFELLRKRVVNHDGTKLKTEPDLCFKLRADEEARVLANQFALFVECKPVDATHAAGSRYCDDGLQRFITGDYAWAMRDAMMLAYTRDARTIAGNLLPAMREPDRRKKLGIVTLPRPVARPEELHGMPKRSIAVGIGGKFPCPRTKGQRVRSRFIMHGMTPHEDPSEARRSPVAAVCPTSLGHLAFAAAGGRVCVRTRAVWS